MTIEQVRASVEAAKSGLSALDGVAGKMAEALAAERAAHAAEADKAKAAADAAGVLAAALDAERAAHADTAAKAADASSLSVAPAVLDGLAADLDGLVGAINEAANKYAALVAG